MISVEIWLDAADETKEALVARAYMREAPHVGSLLWIPTECRSELRHSVGTSSFRVKEIAHWVHPGWHPNTHVGEPIHSVYVAVEADDPETATKGVSS